MRKGGRLPARALQKIAYQAFLQEPDEIAVFLTVSDEHSVLSADPPVSYENSNGHNSKYAGETDDKRHIRPSGTRSFGSTWYYGFGNCRHKWFSGIIRGIISPCWYRCECTFPGWEVSLVLNSDGKKGELRGVSRIECPAVFSSQNAGRQADPGSVTVHAYPDSIRGGIIISDREKWHIEFNPCR